MKICKIFRKIQCTNFQYKYINGVIYKLAAKVGEKQFISLKKIVFLEKKLYTKVIKLFETDVNKLKKLIS